jgi:two-component system phosphate regulon response regulator PhoB
LSSRRILIVDDDESVRSLLRMTLPEDGYQIDEATDGERALALVEERVPDLVLLDWKMPGRHGSLVLDELKSRHPQLPVIVLTAEIAEHHRNLAESLKVDVFLTKPFSPLELLETIERLLGEHAVDETL